MKSLKAIIGDRKMVTVERTKSVVEAARLMAEHQIGAVPVLEGDRLVGIFSERDILVRVVAARRDADRTEVGEVMSTDLIVADVRESYETCMRRMQQAHVRHLPVIDGSRLEGIVSFRDLLAADIDEKSEAITLLNAYVHYIPADVESKLRT
jgi:CBS domain-containing protein